MSTPSFLDFQYNISKRKYLRKPSRLFSSRDRQNSDLPPIFHLNMDELKKVFDKFDSNKDGKISEEEYKAVLGALVKEGVRTEVEKIFQVADLDGDGFIDFKEFVEVHKKGGGVKTRDIQSAFRAFDLNRDGKINAEELLEVLGRLGERCSLEECRRMVRGVDTDGDGAVDIDEFTTMMTRSM
ncbi:calmodulin-like protein 30 [Vitis vinifera]|uniref:EF-hand domain-containing protein n=1 Tax=Vitis vinifera TaxID=29760 RepID=F6HQB7_VITVI|nr:calmodulin-like protein 30 [Vitis vinifera]|eukprot:XP_002285223.1 PREDICTED: calmodulin-like protein 1 [Vitis vinifera]